MAGDWTLAIDFGTTFTSAAIAVDGQLEVLEVDGLRRLPSVVLLLDGEIVVGAAAEGQRLAHPEATERNPKRSLGVRSHLLLGQTAVPVVDAVAYVLHAVHVEALRRRGGEPPARVVLTHPARWSASRIEALGDAARLASLPNVSFLAEPVAAAMHFADTNVPVGGYVAVYDLGGGTFDTAVLRRTDTGFELAGPPGGDERLGGEDFDRRLMDFLVAQLAVQEPDLAAHLQSSPDPAWRLAAVQLLDEARKAKEALSRQTTHRVMLPHPLGTELRITRPELDALIRADIQGTVDELRATIERAGLQPSDVTARYLTGGSSRIPLISRMLHDAFNDAPDTFDDPKVAVALGAARSNQLTDLAVASGAAGSATSGVASEGTAPPPDGTAATTMNEAIEPPGRAEAATATAEESTDVGARRTRRRALVAAAVILVILAGAIASYAVTRGGTQDVQLATALSPSTTSTDAPTTASSSVVGGGTSSTTEPEAPPGSVPDETTSSSDASTTTTPTTTSTTTAPRVVTTPPTTPRTQPPPPQTPTTTAFVPPSTTTTTAVPRPTVILSGPSSLYVGQSIRISAQYTNAVSNRWIYVQENTELASNRDFLDVTCTKPGTKTVRVFAYNSAGQDSFGEITITCYQP